jgi:sugar/nucleoside kinase (ribokinase family)
MPVKPGSAEGRVVVIGELNVDLIATGLESAPLFGGEILAGDFEMTLGSASAIFACGVARLGHEVTFVSRVGCDAFGRFCLEALRRAGIATRRVAQDAGFKTGVTVSLSTRRDRALVTYLGAIAEVKAEQVPPEIFRGHRHLHLTSFFLQRRLRPHFPAIMAEARRRGLTTSFDPNADPAQDWGADIQEVLRETEMLLVNEEEARFLTRQKKVEVALERLGRLVPCVAIKLGSRGALGLRGGEVAFAPGFKVGAVDTTGAGDSFAAGFVHGALAGKNLGECLELGNACGALSTMQAGGTTSQPDRTRLTQFLQTIKKQAASAAPSSN